MAVGEIRTGDLGRLAPVQVDDVAQCRHQGIERKGLGKKQVRAGFVSLFDKGLVTGSGINDYRDILVGTLLDQPQAFKAVPFGHIDIEEYNIGVQFFQLGRAGANLRFVRHRNVVTDGAYRFAEEEEVVLVIINEENVFDGPLVDIHTMTFKV